jgi:hypothetical protein
MSEPGGDPWSRLWQAWIARANGMATKGAPDGLSGNPLEAAMAGLRSFGAAVSAVAAAAAPGAQADALADYIDTLHRAGATVPGSEWAAVPFLWSAGLLDGAGAQSWRGVFDTGAAWIRELLDLPALGPQREWQEAVKAVVRAELAEQAAHLQLQTQQRRAQALALRRFAHFLRDASGPPVTSLRSLYDAWIGIAERAHRDVVMEAGYSRDFGAWVDAANTTRLALRRLEARVAETLDQPHQGAIEALATRQAELQAEIGHLRGELARLERTVPAAAAPAKPSTDPVVEGALSHTATPPELEPAVRAPSAAAAGKARATSAKATKKSARKSAQKSAKAEHSPSAAAPPRQRAARPATGREFDIADILGEAS